MKKNQTNISDVPIPDAITAGIEVRRVAPNLVPIFEEHAVRVGSGYTINEWYELDPVARAIEVCYARLDRMVKGHVEAEASRKISRNR